MVYRHCGGGTRESEPGWLGLRTTVGVAVDRDSEAGAGSSTDGDCGIQ